MKSGIYEIVNKVSGKRYIGSALNLRTRKINHYTTLRRNKHHNSHLQNSYNKHGKDNFIFNVLEYCDKDYLRVREQNHIDKYDFDTELYNIKPDVVRQSGWKHTEETKKKIADAHLGVLFTKEHRQRLSEAFKKRSPESIEKMKRSRLGKYAGSDNHSYGKPSPNRKKVAQVDITTGRILKVYDSITEASKITGINRGSIRAVANNYRQPTKTGIYTRKTGGGYKWILVEEGVV